ncbi:MAG: serine dehydratase, partial [Oscillospiraceae bacterium]|nr:serine dehydratase [Oscillospiraceae bacterium]
MNSIRELYKIGKGPSSSHTMGPQRAAGIFKEEHPDAESFRVVLYGSLAKTGVGHGTDRVLRETLAPIPAEIVFAKEDPDDLKHPNTLDFFAVENGREVGPMRVQSIGGGDIVIEGRP